MLLPEKPRSLSFSWWHSSSHNQRTGLFIFTASQTSPVSSYETQTLSYILEARLGSRHHVINCFCYFSFLLPFVSEVTLFQPPLLSFPKAQLHALYVDATGYINIFIILPRLPPLQNLRYLLQKHRDLEQVDGITATYRKDLIPCCLDIPFIVPFCGLFICEKCLSVSLGAYTFSQYPPVRCSQSFLGKPFQLSKGSSSDPWKISGPDTVHIEELLSVEAALNRHMRSKINI